MVGRRAHQLPKTLLHFVYGTYRRRRQTFQRRDHDRHHQRKHRGRQHQQRVLQRKYRTDGQRRGLLQKRQHMDGGRQLYGYYRRQSDERFDAELENQRACISRQQHVDGFFFESRFRGVRRDETERFDYREQHGHNRARLYVFGDRVFRLSEIRHGERVALRSERRKQRGQGDSDKRLRHGKLQVGRQERQYGARGGRRFERKREHDFLRDDG